MTIHERRALRLYPHYFRNRRPRSRHFRRLTWQPNYAMTQLLRAIGAMP